MHLSLRPRQDAAGLYPNAAVLVRDDFVEEPSLCRSLQDLHNSLRPDPRAGARFWRIGMRGRQALPKPVQDFVRLLCSLPHSPGIEGIEYWTNTLGKGELIVRHVDKDETLYRRQGIVVCPVFSAVYYPDACDFEGGALWVAGRTIRPRFNRLVLFAGNVRHGVHRVRAGVRRSLVVNAWLHRPSIQ